MSDSRLDPLDILNSTIDDMPDYSICRMPEYDDCTETEVVNDE